MIRRSSERTLQVGERQWPAMFGSLDVELAGLCHYRRQAQVMFEGGVVSVIWGSATYSTNHDHGPHDEPTFTEEPTVVEVGMWDDDGTLHVLAYVPAAPLNTMLEFLSLGGSVKTVVETWKSNGGALG